MATLPRFAYTGYLAVFGLVGRHCLRTTTHPRAGAPRDRAVAAILMPIEMPSLRMDHKEAITAALGFWAEHSALDCADCYHLALTGIYTFDKRMDGFPGVDRAQR